MAVKVGILLLLTEAYNELLHKNTGHFSRFFLFVLFVFFLLKHFIYLIYSLLLFVCFASMFVCALPACWCSQRSEEGIGIRSPGTGVMNGCEPSCRCWELNSGTLQEQ